ncbi:MAG: hypothetical protein E7389_01230 [Ruminococcaceae bacterium]|nr:hypothetical protein [Oscillospiraceae bacterium]
MKINIKNSSKTVEIWVDSSERATYKEVAEYKDTIATYKGTYTINVFVGGTRPLLQTITELLQEQSKSLAYAS